MTRSTSRALGAVPGEPLECRQSYSNISGQTGVDPGKLIEHTHNVGGFQIPEDGSLTFCCFSEEEINRILSHITIGRNILQGLVVGSGVNWAEDKDLKEVMLGLGKPVQL